MALSFRCQHCGKDIIVRYLRIGEVAKCRHCGNHMAVPEESTEIESVPEQVRSTTGTVPGISSETHSPPITNPWTGIWFHPREAIRLALTRNRQTEAYALAGIYGIVHHFHLMQRYGVSPELGVSLWEILAANIVAGAIFGYLTLVLSSWAVSWVGRLLGGTGSATNARIAIGWSCLPYTVLLIIIPLMFIDPETFVYQPRMQVPVSALSGYYLLLRNIITIWFLLIIVSTISEALRLSIGRSILALLSPIILLVPASLLLILLYTQIYG